MKNDNIVDLELKEYIMARLRRKTWTMDFLKEQPYVVLEPEKHKGSWNDFFGNDKPIHAELGMGKGKFINELSTKHADINYIGIDMYDELIRHASEKIEQTPDNLAFVLYNIESLEQIFSAGELERIYLNFSDPWPKKRHARRRLTHPDFVKKYLQILKPAGEIHLKTDSVSLFEFSLNSFADLQLKMQDISLDVHREGTPPGHVFTEYESKFAEQGDRIHFCRVLCEAKG